MARVYIETSIVSYLAAQASRDVVTLARQQLTREWWDTRRDLYSLVTSVIVLDEARAGDKGAADRRLQMLSDLPLLELGEDAETLARHLVLKGPLPDKAAIDAAHIALCSTRGIDYLLTWNCTHIANAVLRKPIERICRSMGYEPPVMCTPEELLSE